MDHAQPDPAAEDSPAPEAQPDPKRHTKPSWLEHSYTPQPVPPDTGPPAPTPPRPPAGHTSDPALESPSLPQPGSFRPGAPLETTLAETRATLRALASGSAHGYDMDEYRLDVEAPTPREEAGSEPPWLTPESGSEASGGNPMLSVSRLRSLPEDREEPGYRGAWKTQLLDRLRSDPRTQLIVLACLVVLALIPLFARKASQTSLSQIRKHPQRYDGQVVTVEGRVGQVFSMGGSHVYYLHQGRDTLVVFTRLSPPLPLQKVTVKGSVSTGYLEGVARVALFDSGP
jgi:hypothetical protein